MLQKLGKYEIVAEVGRGAMGAVYKAYDPAIDRPVALKTITSSLVGDPGLLDRFYREARSAGKLQHPNIVTVYELGQEGETPFIAMEFLDGETLEKLIAQRPDLSLLEKVGFIVSVCHALEFAHQRGVIHRDIKPGNIMVTKDGTVKVVDFGIARITDGALQTRTNTLIGTLAYMSPQQLRGERADARSDIWALGLTFYELLSWQRPFYGDNQTALMLDIIDAGKELRPLDQLVPGCPLALAVLIAKMLEKDITKRYQTMEEVLLDLEPLWKTIQEEGVAHLVADSETARQARDFSRARRLARKALEVDGRNAQAKTLLEQIDAEAKQNQASVPEAETVFSAGLETVQGGKPAAAPAATGVTRTTLYPPAAETRSDQPTIAGQAPTTPGEFVATTYAAGTASRPATRAGQSSPASSVEFRQQSDPHPSADAAPAGMGRLIREKPLAVAIPALAAIIIVGVILYFVLQKPAASAGAQQQPNVPKPAAVTQPVSAEEAKPAADQPVSPAISQYSGGGATGEPAQSVPVAANTSKKVSRTPKAAAEKASKPNSDSRQVKAQGLPADTTQVSVSGAPVAAKPAEDATPSAASDAGQSQPATGKCLVPAGDIEIWLSRADGNRAKGSYADAERQYGEVLACDPRNERALAGLTKTRQAEALPSRSN